MLGDDKFDIQIMLKWPNQAIRLNVYIQPFYYHMA